MNTKFHLTLIILVGCVRVVVAESDKTQPSAGPTNNLEITIARMSMRTSKGTFTLLDLHRKAVIRLRDKYADCREFFDRASEFDAIPTVNVEVGSLDKLVELTYGGGLGKPVWAVTFSTSGTISSAWSGRSRDRVVDETK